MSKTINAKQTIYASMRTERLLRRSLMCLLALVAICGFAVTPIAGAEVCDAGGVGGDAEDAYLQAIHYAAINLVNEIEEGRCIDEALHAFRIAGASADTTLRAVVSFCDEYNIQSRFNIGEDDNIYCMMALYYPRDHTWEWKNHLLTEDEKAQACSMLIDELNAKGVRYHPEPKNRPHDPFIYHADIGNVTFNFIIEWYYLTDNKPDLYVWFTPEDKVRQDYRELNMVFKFEADTKDLVVLYPDTLGGDISCQNSMMLNFEGYDADYKCNSKWLDKEHKTNGHRHTLDSGQKHTIKISCWEWYCTCPDGSKFAEYSWDIKKK